MKNKQSRVIISEYRNWLIFYSIIFLLGFLGLARDIASLFSNSMDDEVPGMGLIGVILIPIVAYFHLRKKGKIEVTDSYIYASYPNLPFRTMVDLDLEVYYGTYIGADQQLYMVVSNESFVNDFRAHGFKDIDYKSQIQINYKGKIMKLLPKKEWIEIKEIKQEP